MLDRTSAGALSAIAAALALVALAHVPQRAPAAAVPKPTHVSAAATSVAVRALRDGARIDLNRAQPGDLELLPGIGPSLAQRIVDDRKAHGDFTRVDALLRVRGVGPRTLERLRGLLDVDAQLEALPRTRSAILEGVGAGAARLQGRALPTAP
jgi:competence ComEA-like helix-hairpin-helix protein